MYTSEVKNDVTYSALFMDLFHTAIAAAAAARLQNNC